MLRVSEKNSADRTHGFETPSRNACRHLFRCCMDHQAFFRFMASEPRPRSPYSRFRSFNVPDNGNKQHLGRAPHLNSRQATFQRMPSRRKQRPVVEGQEMSGGFVERGLTTIPQSIMTSINGANMGQTSPCFQMSQNSNKDPNNPSPRSTRSAPWTQTQPKGLYTSSSPRSVRSAYTARSVS